ncbi:hypothetical protein DFQ27_000095 [Actinomortierella ambigua]|uniref:Phosphatase n=1 Tax=Actinomortierella ambigua TaxID=1343610 RepID=A0A9P6QJ01_9FUNG|nr:hypothetical protein DFQ27_000095 [Actinomortierella ambigua]
MSAASFPIRCKGLLFDMDGTLIDTTIIVESNWKKWCDANGVVFEELIAVSHGRPSFEILREFTPVERHAETLSPEYIKNLEDLVTESTEGMIIIPGTRALLESIPRDKWAVVTSAGRNMANTRFVQTGLPTPPILVSASDIVLGKPNPEGYLKAAKAMGVDPSECVVFEDAPAGIRAGSASGAKAVIGMNTGTMDHKHLVEAGASPIINSFEEIEVKFLEDGWIEICKKA